MHKLVILYNTLCAWLVKWCYDLGLLRVPCLGERPQTDVVVSLTSYGRRVKDGVVCYTLYSLLRQTIQPKRIVLWVDAEKWNCDNLPGKLKKLQGKGVEVMFVKDMRSYTKLFPALANYPKETVITADDDILYPSTLIELLVAGHETHPDAIVGFYMRKPIMADKQLLPYSRWTFVETETFSADMLPLGVGGVLYPAGALKAEMLDYAIAKQYSPLADDVWFWASGMAAGSCKYRPEGKLRVISFDALYQYFHRGSALQHSNVKDADGLNNDKQIESTMQYVKEHYTIDIVECIK